MMKQVTSLFQYKPHMSLNLQTWQDVFQVETDCW